MYQVFVSIRSQSLLLCTTYIVSNLTSSSSQFLMYTQYCARCTFHTMFSSAEIYHPSITMTRIYITRKFQQRILKYSQIGWIRVGNQHAVDLSSMYVQVIYFGTVAYIYVIGSITTSSRVQKPSLLGLLAWPNAQIFDID